MPFPFLPGGAILAAAVLIGALTAFGLLLRTIDRALVGTRDTAVTGIVTGLRTWGAGRSARIPAEPLGPASAWSLAGMKGWPISPLPAPVSGTIAPAFDPVPPPELIDLGSRRIDRPDRSRR